MDFKRRLAWLFLPLLLFSAALAWLALSENAARFVLTARLMEGVQLSGVHGRLLGPLSIERIEIHQKEQTLTLEQTQIDWQPWALWKRELHIRQLHIARWSLVAIDHAPHQALVLPDSLTLPLQVRLDQVQVDAGQLDQVNFNWLSQGKMHLSASFDGHQYRLQLAAQLTTNLPAHPLAAPMTGDVSAQLTLSAQRPYAIEGGITVDAVSPVLPVSQKIKAQLQLNGDLSAVQSEVRLQIDQAKLHANLTLAAFSPAPAITLSGQLENFQPQTLGYFSSLPSLSLTGSFKGQAQLLPKRRAAIEWHITQGQLAGQTLRSDGRATLEDERLSIASCSVQTGANRLDAQGELRPVGGQLRFTLQAPRIDQLGRGYGGAVEVKGELTGSLDQARLNAHWVARQLSLPSQALQLKHTEGDITAQLGWKQTLRIDAVTMHARVSDLRGAASSLAQADLQLQFGMQAQAPLKLDVQLDDLRAPQIKAQKLILHALGKTAEHTIAASLVQARKSATLPEQRWQIRLQGGLLFDAMKSANAAHWEGRLTQFKADGQLTASLADAAPLYLSAERQELSRVHLQSGSTQLNLTHFLRDASGIHSQGNLSRLALVSLLSFSAAPSSLSITSDLLFDGEWDFRLADSLSGSMAVRRSAGDVTLTGITPLRLGLRRLEATLSAQSGGLLCHLTAEGETLGRIALELQSFTSQRGSSSSNRISSNTISSTDTIAGHASLSMPTLRWLGPLLDPELQSAGELNSEIAITGTLGEPLLSGKMTGRAMRFYLTDSGVDLRNGEFESEWHGDQLHIKRLQFNHAGGQLLAQGELSLGADHRSANLALKAEHYPLIARSDRSLVVSGSTEFDWRAAQASIRGALQLDAANIDIGRVDRPVLGEDVVVLGSAKKSTPPLKAMIDLAISLGENVHITGQGIDANLGGQLRLTGDPDSSLQAQGIIKVINGTYVAYGKKLVIEHGVLKLNGPLNNPVLDISAMRRDQEVAAGVAVRGTMQAPRVTLLSEPSVPDAEKLSWLVLGQSLNNAGSADLTILNSATSALFAAGPANGIRSQIAARFGLDDISFRSQTQDNVQQRIIRFGKQINPRLTVLFQQSLQSVGSVLVMRYTLSPQFSIEAEAGTRGALRLIYQISVD